MRNARKYAKNTMWIFAERAVQLGIGFTIGIWVVRYLGPASYGAFSYALSIVGLCAPIATLGLDAILVRALIRHPNQHHLWMGSAFFLRLLAALLLLVFLYLLLVFRPMIDPVRGMIFILSLSLIAPAIGIIDSYFQHRVVAVLSVQAKVIALLCSSLGKVALILAQAPVFYFALVLTLESVLLGLGLVYNYHRLGQHIRAWRWKGEIAFSLCKEAWPVWLTGIAIAAYLKVDQIMVQHWLGLDAVGQYSAAVRVSEVLFFIPAALTSTFYPPILTAKAQNEERYQRRLQYFYDLMIWSGFFIALALWVLGPQLMLWFYGETYLPACAVIRWHVPSLLFVFMSQAGSRWFLAENRQRFLLLLHFSGAVLNIGLNVFLIPLWGLKGAALATVISYAAAAYGGLFFLPAAWPNLRLLSRSFYLPGVIGRIRRANRM